MQTTIKEDFRFNYKGVEYDPLIMLKNIQEGYLSLGT